MNENEQQDEHLEAMLRDGGWVEPLGSVNLERVAAESGRRSRRRRAVMGSAITVLVVAAAVGVAQAIANTSSNRNQASNGPVVQRTAKPGSNSVVPWVAAKPTAPPTPAACAKDDLTFKLGRRGAYHGEATLQIEVRNTSAMPCTAPGNIAVAAVGAARGTVKVTNDQPAAPSVLAPQKALMIMIGTPTVGCGASAEIAPGLSVSVGSIAAPALSNARLRLDCGTPNVIQTYAEEADPATENIPLSATIDAPSSVSSGSTLQFNVTLTNKSDTAIKFSDCPNYTEGLKGSQVNAGYQLNCAAVPEIPAGGSVTLAMQLAAPAGTTPSTDLLGWSLTGYPASAGAPITVN